MRIVLAALIIMGAVTAASSQDGTYRRYLVRSCDIFDYCTWKYKYRPIRHRPAYYAPRVYSYERREREFTLERDVDRNPKRCAVDQVKVVGVERYGTDRAKESADGQWMETVRANMGAKMMDLRNAKHVSYECWQSSTGNRASEKAADVGGKFLEQCELRAIPCRASRVEDDRR